MPTNAVLRQLRAKWFLSQEELAELLNVDQGRISRYERAEECPTLAVALAFQVVFGPGPRTLFRSAYSSVEEAVMGRAAELERKLAGRNDFSSAKKRQLLEGMMERATNRRPV